jgi:hypothetical protein
MHESVRKVAFKERRSVAAATRLLLEEALRARRRGKSVSVKTARKVDAKAPAVAD